MFNRTRKRMMLAALAAMSLAGAGAQGKADLPMDGTTARTMAIGGERRANSLDFPTPPDYSTGRVGVIGMDPCFYQAGSSSFVPTVHKQGTESPVYQAFDSPQVSDFDFLVVSFGIPSDVFDNSICQVMLGESSPIPFKTIFGWQMDGVGSDSLSLVMRASSVRRQQDEGTLLEAVQAMFPVFSIADAMSATGDNNELMSAMGSNLKVAVSGFNVDPLIQDGETAEVYVNVDDPLTIEQILANVSAEDLLGETVQVQCTETEKQKYKPSTLGVYKVTVTATDKYGQTATCYLNIHVVDTVPPEITLLKALDFAAGDTLQFSKVGEYVQVTDNGTGHGGSIGNATYTIDGQPFTSDRVWGPSDVGTHTLKVTVADSSGNSSTKEFQITVRDIQAPVITMRDGADGNLLIGLSRVLNFSESDFLALFQATDNVTPSDEIVLDVEGSFIPSKVGNYDIKVVATDKAGNKGSYTCHVTVDADLPPVFILSDALVGATAESPLSSAQIQSIVVNALYAGREVSDVLIDDSEYQANATRKGSYAVSYSVKVHSGDGSVSTEEGSLTVRVDDSAGDAEEEEKTGWERFCEWWTVDFVRFWQRLGNWFRGVFTKFEWDCFITNEEWDARFPSEDAAE